MTHTGYMLTFILGLHLLALLFSGLVAGMYIGVWLVVVPTLKGASGVFFTQLHQGVHQTYGKVAPFMLLTACVTEVILIFAEDLNVSLFMYASVLCLMVAIAATYLGNQPLSRQIKVWKPDWQPAHWQEIRSRWDRYHVVRTGAAVLGFTLLLMAGLIA